MNFTTHQIYAFYHLSIAVRDALEYVTVRDEYSLETYNFKKNAMQLGLKENTPFALFCKNNGEKGQKINDEFKAFYETVYGENSQFIRVNDGKVEVDHSLNSKVLRELVPLKLSLYNILKLHCENKNQPEEVNANFIELFDYEEKYFEVITSMVVTDYVFRDRFLAFNKAKKEAQGNDTVESNFIQSELNDALSLYNFVKSFAEKLEHKEFIGLETYVNRGIELITGKTMPKEGKKIDEELKEIYDHHQQIVAELEPIYKKMHYDCYNELSKFEEEKRKAEQN